MIKNMKKEKGGGGAVKRGNMEIYPVITPEQTNQHERNQAAP